MSDASLQASHQAWQVFKALIDVDKTRVEAAADAIDIMANQMQAMCWEPKCVCYLRGIAAELCNNQFNNP
jgi:hypothetical protein